MGKRDCHNSKYAKVGDSCVFLCGKDNLDLYAIREIKKLDIFIGMDESWSKFLPRNYSNKFCKLFKQFVGSTEIENLFIHKVYDRGVDEDFADAVIKVFMNNWKIGFGCMGGHGRTGWLFGKLLYKVEELRGEKLLKQIRKRLCKQALESKDQFESLGLKDLYQEMPLLGLPWFFDEKTRTWSMVKSSVAGNLSQEGGEINGEKEVDVSIIGQGILGD